MTWQRIDENTYIDDTLVTCAEYQLFIDEMREQGKYYQPDHWTSYQFPAGQARQPILGVRHSDAVAFSGWLTQREGSEWKYRLPHAREALKYSMTPIDKSSIGYWIIPTQALSSGSWIVAVKHPSIVYDEIPPGNWGLEEDGTFQFLWIYKPPSEVDDEKSIHPLNLDVECNRYFEICNRLLNKNELRNYQERKRAKDLIRDLDRIAKRTYDLRSWVHRSFISRTLKNAHLLRYYPTYTLTNQILCWQDRVIGGAPAFEGIRIVKALGMDNPNINLDKHPEIEKTGRKKRSLFQRLLRAIRGDISRDEERE